MAPLDPRGDWQLVMLGAKRTDRRIARVPEPLAAQTLAARACNRAETWAEKTAPL